MTRLLFTHFLRASIEPGTAAPSPSPLSYKTPHKSNTTPFKLLAHPGQPVSAMTKAGSLKAHARYCHAPRVVRVPLKFGCIYIILYFYWWNMLDDTGINSFVMTVLINGDCDDEVRTVMMLFWVTSKIGLCNRRKSCNMGACSLTQTRRVRTRTHQTGDDIVLNHQAGQTSTSFHLFLVQFDFLSCLSPVWKRVFDHFVKAKKRKQEYQLASCY